MPQGPGRGGAAPGATSAAVPGARLRCPRPLAGAWAPRGRRGAAKLWRLRRRRLALGPLRRWAARGSGNFGGPAARLRAPSGGRRWGLVVPSGGEGRIRSGTAPLDPSRAPSGSSSANPSPRLRPPGGLTRTPRPRRPGAGAVGRGAGPGGSGSSEDGGAGLGPTRRTRGVGKPGVADLALFCPGAGGRGELGPRGAGAGLGAAARVAPCRAGDEGPCRGGPRARLAQAGGCRPTGPSTLTNPSNQQGPPGGRRERVGGHFFCQPPLFARAGAGPREAALRRPGPPAQRRIGPMAPSPGPAGLGLARGREPV